MKVTPFEALTIYFVGMLALYALLVWMYRKAIEMPVMNEPYAMVVVEEAAMVVEEAAEVPQSTWDALTNAVSPR